MNQLPRSIDEHKSLKRNIVAHHSRLWNRSLGKKIIDPKGKRNAWLNGELTEIQKKKPYAVICAIAYLCKAVIFQHGFPNAVKYLCTVFPDIPLSKFAFPVRCEKEPLWR